MDLGPSWHLLTSTNGSIIAITACIGGVTFSSCAEILAAFLAAVHKAQVHQEVHVPLSFKTSHTTETILFVTIQQP